MTWPQVILSALLVATLALFIWSRLRQDLVAWLALVVATLAGLIGPDDAWAGLSHPAVVSVAAVLVISYAVSSAGVVDLAVRPLNRIAKRPMLLLAGLLAATAALSAFINNVGALALMMPVAIRLAKVAETPASVYLMPMAFASLLGGMTTLIGTPPNLIVAGFRGQNGGSAFSMFHFAWVGVPVAVGGVVFLALVGYRLVPHRTSQVGSRELFDIAPYLTEAHITEKSPLAGESVGDSVPADVTLLAVVRGQKRYAQPSAYLPLRVGDVLVLMGEGEVIEKFAKEKNLDIAGAQAARKARIESKADEAGSKDGEAGGQASFVHPAESADVGVAEAVVKASSWVAGSSAASLRLRERFGVNLLGLAREGARRSASLATTRFRAGDVLLLQGHRDDLPARIADLGCLPLAERKLSIGDSTKLWRASSVFALAIALVAAGVVAAPVAFVSAVVLMVLTRVLSARQVYEAIDWPVLSLLAAMIPLGHAIETTGLAELISRGALWTSNFVPAWGMVAVLLVATMFLSDLVNNAAAALMMCPIALGMAHGLSVSADSLLIAVATGASCAFLTPVGHQSNLLVMGPGGYRFGDYWRCGLLLELVIAAVAVPAILVFWPLR